MEELEEDKVFEGVKMDVELEDLTIQVMYDDTGLAAIIKEDSSERDEFTAIEIVYAAALLYVHAAEQYNLGSRPNNFDVVEKTYKLVDMYLNQPSEEEIQ